MIKRRAAVFASGTGSNFVAIMEQNGLNCDIVYLVCDQSEAAVIAKAEAYGVKTIVLSPKKFPTKEAYEQEILDQLQSAQVEWIFLAGYMRIIGETLLKPYAGKMINIHPSLLPEFPGVDAIGQAFTAGVSVTGVTVHYVDAGIDTGPIIDQRTVEILPNDTKETLQQRIQTVEHELYAKVIRKLMRIVD